jgi:excisionase family DNA binding protein
MELETSARLHRLGTVLEQTSLSRSAIYREIKAGHLKVVKIGRSVRVSEAELKRFITALSEEQAN